MKIITDRRMGFILGVGLVATACPASHAATARWIYLYNKCRFFAQTASRVKRLETVDNHYAAAARTLGGMLKQMPKLADDLRRAGRESLHRSRWHRMQRPFSMYIQLCQGGLDSDFGVLSVFDWKEARTLVDPYLNLVRKNNQLRVAMDKLTNMPNADHLVAMECEFAATLCWKARRRHEAIGFIRQAIPLFRQYITTLQFGHGRRYAQSDVFVAEAVEKYFVDLAGVRGFQGFLKDVAPIIARYKNTSWICREAMMELPIPHFATGGDDPRLYAYYLVVQHQLGANHTDPCIERLYFDLGSTAQNLGLTKDAIKWYQKYLQLYPHASLASAVRKVLAGITSQAARKK
ncbi:MAG: hypothetical protein ACP5I8_13615 [Phycisphaerae bacterium]